MSRWVGLWVAVALLGWASGAEACAVCSEYNFCQTTASGASACLGNGLWCMQSGRCRSFLKYGDAMIQLALLEDSPVLAAGGPSHVVRHAGAMAVGRSARRIAAGGREAGAGVRFSLLGYQETGTTMFKTPSGDGFALRREREGRGARVEVLAIAAGLPGRTLARERLDADDALVVRVPFEGRTCVLVLQAATLPPAEAAARAAAARREVEESAAESLVSERPPFEFDWLER